MPPPRPVARDSFAFVLLIGFTTSIQAIGTTLIIPALPDLAREFAAGPELVQLAVSGYLVGLAAGQVLSGPFADRFGRRPVLLGGFGICVAASVGCVLAPSIAALIGMRALQGFGAAAGMIVGRAIVRDCFQGARAIQVMSGLSAIVSIVPAAGPPLAGLLLQFMSWRGVLGLIALFAVAIGASIWLCLSESIPRRDPHAISPRRVAANALEMLRRADSMSFALIAAILFGGLMAMITLLGYVVRDSFGLGPGVAGLLIGGTAFGYMLGSIANNRYAARRPPARVLSVSTAWIVVAAAATLAAALAIDERLADGIPALAMLYVPMLGYQVLLGFIYPTSIAIYLRPLPHI